MSSALMNTYGRLPVSFTHGEGSYLYDTNGKRYLDGIAGIGVNALGHNHPAVSQAIAEQAQRVIHTSNLYRIEVQEQLAQRLTNAANMDRCFFGNSGAEANEAAIKLARLHGRARDIQKPAIIVMENAFHGRTMATLSATGNRKIQAGFEPLVTGFIRAPLMDLAALQHIARNNNDVVAVMLEPIQGEAGIIMTDSAYLQGVRALCDEQNWLLILDEVQTGNGRTGDYFAYLGAGILPDVVTTAKALANGVPIGACLARGSAADLFQQGDHGSTYGGNPLACAAALAVIDTIETEQLCQRAATVGRQMRERFAAQLGANPLLVEVRGRGLMLGVELAQPCTDLVVKALEKGFLINVTAGNTIRLLPPLTISDDEAFALVDAVCELVEEFSQSHLEQSVTA